MFRSIVVVALLIVVSVAVALPAEAQGGQWSPNMIDGTSVSSVSGRNGVLTLSVGCRGGAHILILSLPANVAIQVGLAELTWADGTRNFHRLRGRGGVVFGSSDFSDVSELVTKFRYYTTVRIRAMDERFEVVDQFDLAGSSDAIRACSPIRG